MVRLNHLIAKGDDCDLVWRKGVVLEDNDCRAKVTEEENREGLKVVDIAVTGRIAERKFLLRKIREEVQAIHQKWFKNIQTEQMIPCNCDYCLNPAHPTPKFFELSDIERAVDRNQPTIQCVKEFLNVPIMGLLEGVFEQEELQHKTSFREQGGFGMTDKNVTHVTNTTVTNNIETLGAMGGTGNDHTVTGTVIINAAQKQEVAEFKDALTALMQDIGNHEADFKIKNAAYNELVEINEHLGNLETIPVETQGKLRELLGGIKEGSSCAIQLAKKIKDKEDTLVWLAEKAVVVSALLPAILF